MWLLLNHAVNLVVNFFNRTFNASCSRVVQAARGNEEFEAGRSKHTSVPRTADDAQLLPPQANRGVPVLHDESVVAHPATPPTKVWSSSMLLQCYEIFKMVLINTYNKYRQEGKKVSMV